MNTMRLSLLTSLLLAGTAWAGEYENALLRVEQWINQTYPTGTLANQSAMKKLHKIAESDASESKKIASLKTDFPSVPGEKNPVVEEDLLARPPILWNVHSLSIGYDIKESTTQTRTVTSIFDELHTQEASHVNERSHEQKSSHNVGAHVGANLKLSLNPLSWVKEIFKNSESSSGISLGGHYDYDRKNSSAENELWSQKKQDLCRREQKTLEEIIQRKNIKKLN